MLLDGGIPLFPKRPPLLLRLVELFELFPPKKLLLELLLKKLEDWNEFDVLLLREFSLNGEFDC